MLRHGRAGLAVVCAASLASAAPSRADTFAPFFVCPGDALFVSGNERDGARVIAFFEQPPERGEATEVGSAIVGASGQYRLRAEVPATASPGPACVVVRSPSSGRSWHIHGLTVLSRCARAGGVRDST